MEVHEPLTRWRCDTCREWITGVEDGYVEFIKEYSSNGAQTSGFRIVHNGGASPCADTHRHGCFLYEDRRDITSGTIGLGHFVGVEGLVVLLSFLDIGEEFSPDHDPEPKDIRGWTTFFRRVQLPYYEQAREVMPGTLHEDGCNEVAFYLPDTLRRLIEEA